jgi:hypothetical protein
MNKILALSALLASATAPQLALADSLDASQDATQLITQLASPGAGTRFVIVDPSTGRIVAVLVPVAGSPNTLRLIGSVRAGSPELLPARAIAPEALTPEQMRQKWQRDEDAQFHILHDGG